MTFNRQAGGHAFDVDRGVCAKCGMSREHYEDNAEPRCIGAKAPQLRANELEFILPVSEIE
jgi:hypothetical protein